MARKKTSSVGEILEVFRINPTEPAADSAEDVETEPEVKHRLQLDVTQDFLKELDGQKKVLGENTRSVVIRRCVKNNALLFDLIAGAKWLVITDENGKILHQVPVKVFR